MSETTPLGRVMMIDDEQIDQMIYRRIIDRSGMAEEIIGFTYAEDALAYLLDPANPPIDLILLDINMPRMTGFEFLQATTDALGPDLHAAVVIMLTTSLNPQDRARAQAFEMVRGYINKPLKQENLVAAVAALKERPARSGV